MRTLVAIVLLSVLAYAQQEYVWGNAVQLPGGTYYLMESVSGIAAAPVTNTLDREDGWKLVATLITPKNQIEGTFIQTYPRPSCIPRDPRYLVDLIRTHSRDLHPCPSLHPNPRIEVKE